MWLHAWLDDRTHSVMTKVLVYLEESLQGVRKCLALFSIFTGNLDEVKGSMLIKGSVVPESGDSIEKSSWQKQDSKRSRQNDRSKWARWKIESGVKLKQLDAPGKGALSSCMKNESSGSGWLHPWYKLLAWHRRERENIFAVLYCMYIVVTSEIKKIITTQHSLYWILFEMRQIKWTFMEKCRWGRREKLLKQLEQPLSGVSTHMECGEDEVAIFT